MFQCHYDDCLRTFRRKTSLTNHLKAHKNVNSRSINRSKRARRRTELMRRAARATAALSASIAVAQNERTNSMIMTAGGMSSMNTSPKNEEKQLYIDVSNSETGENFRIVDESNCERSSEEVGDERKIELVGDELVCGLSNADMDSRKVWSEVVSEGVVGGRETGIEDGSEIGSSGIEAELNKAMFNIEWDTELLSRLTCPSFGSGAVADEYAHVSESPLTIFTIATDMNAELEEVGRGRSEWSVFGDSGLFSEAELCSIDRDGDGGVSGIGIGIDVFGITKEDNQMGFEECIEF